MFSLLLSSAYTAPRPFLLLALPRQRAGWGAKGAGRGHSRDSHPQLTPGIFHTTGHHAQQIKWRKKKEGGDVHSDAICLPK